LSDPDRLPEDDKVSTPPLRVMLVDDHEAVRDGIKALLAATDDLIVCAEAASVRQAVAEADRALPDVIVMDVRLQDGSGIEATRDIRGARPATQVLMLTSFADDQALFASIMAGAAGYVLKQIRGDDLVQAIRTVGAGQSLLDPAVTKGVLDRLRTGKHLLKDERLARLSPQEERIADAGSIDQQVILGSGLAPVDRIRAGQFPPRRARTLTESMDARDQSTCPSSPSQSSSRWCSCAHTPACCQSCSRRQQVTGLPQPNSRAGGSRQGTPARST
jgi:two-component system response regulator DevR